MCFQCAGIIAAIHLSTQCFGELVSDIQVHTVVDTVHYAAAGQCAFYILVKYRSVAAKLQFVSSFPCTRYVKAAGLLCACICRAAYGGVPVYRVTYAEGVVIGAVALPVECGIPVKKRDKYITALVVKLIVRELQAVHFLGLQEWVTLAQVYRVGGIYKGIELAESGPLYAPCVGNFYCPVIFK